MRPVPLKSAMSLFVVAILLLVACETEPAAEPDPPEPVEAAEAPEPEPEPVPDEDSTEEDEQLDDIDTDDHDPFEPYPDAEGEFESASIAQSVVSLSFVPLQIAVHMNFFGHQGLDLEFMELTGGATALQALTAGSIDMVDSASLEVLGAIAGGADLVAIQGTINMTMELCVHNDWLDEHGLSADLPLEERLAGLEGGSFGITGPGAITDRGLRWLLTAYGGLDPDTDTDIVQIGGPDSLAAALEGDQITGFFFAPPTCHLTNGEGEVLMSAADVPEFADYIHQVLYVTREWLEENPEAARRAATAISMGNNFVIQYPEETLEIIQEGPFSHVDPEFVEEAFYSLILPQVEAVENGLMSESSWANTNTVLVEAGFIDEPLDATEGGFWTNEYIDVEAAQVR